MGMLMLKDFVGVNMTVLAIEIRMFMIMVPIIVLMSVVMGFCGVKMNMAVFLGHCQVCANQHNGQGCQK